MMSQAIRAHEDWATPAFDLAPVAPDTGPFAGRDVLEAWHRHRGGDGKVLLVEGFGALLPLYADPATIRFLGEADLTDYHSPLGPPDAVRALTAEFFADTPPGTVIALDSLPAEAADPLRDGLRDAGITVASAQHEVTAVLSLPSDFDEWLASIGKKERHEVRRKRRRFEEELGRPLLVRVEGRSAVDTFTEFHRASAGDKGAFMTPEMVALFHNLHEEAGAVVDLLKTPDHHPVAAAFGFEDADAYYLYNSAYDPAVRHASPGIVMLAALIERSIEAGRDRFDFLKGDEPYKFRHGADARPLYELRGAVE